MASPLLSWKFQTPLLVGIGALSAICLVSWPIPWAKDMAKAQVETCYADDLDGWAEGCHGSRRDLKDAAERYGMVKSHRILSVTRGFSNREYTVTLEAERERARTLEVVKLTVGYSNSQERRYSYSDSVEVRPR